MAITQEGKELKIESKTDLDRLKINWGKKEPVPAPSSKQKKLRLIVVLIFLLLFAIIAYFFLVEPVQMVEATSAVFITPSHAPSLLNASGYVVANRKSAIASKGTGRLISLKVKEGDHVKKGEILAQLENADVLSALSRARANLNVAHSAKDTAEAELKEATLSYNRGKNLLQENLISKADFDTLEANYSRDKAALDSAEAGVQAAEAAVRSAAIDVDNTYIRAPFNGTVVAKDAEVGEVVAPFGSSALAKAAVLTIADMSSLQVEADVSESNIEKVHVEQHCEIILDAYPDTIYKGIVRTIVPTADRAKATILTKIQFLNPDNRIFPEMSAKVSFLSKLADREPAGKRNDKPVVAVEPTALISKNEQKEVFIIRNQKAIETPVEVGTSIGSLIEIKKGLSPGDQVINHPPAKLISGSKVQVRMKE